ncbi:MAG: hypothetical protein J6Q68_00560 [Clostridia bacterium]|nr:hypothetical protein [Clostridia bacterium]
MENKKTALKIIHVSASALFLGAAVASFLLYAYMAFGFFGNFSLQGTGEGFGDNLGIGLTVGFAAVFMIIFGVAELIASLVGIILHSFIIKVWSGKVRVYGKVALIVNIAMVVVSAAAFVAMLIMT